jgi:hypothetical protein
MFVTPYAVAAGRAIVGTILYIPHHKDPSPTTTIPFPKKNPHYPHNFQLELKLIGTSMKF